MRIDFEGRIDGEVFERGTAKDFDLELGSGSFVPGFEEGLVGAKKGESRDVQATFPEAYSDRSLAGKTAVFAVTVTDVRVAEAVAVDDDLAARFGMADLAALRAAVRERAQRDYRAASRLKLKREILDMLADTHDFPVPVGMVDREFDSIWQQIEQDLKRTGTTWEETDEDEDSAREEYRGIAERRVRLGLVLSEIGRRNNVNVPQDELNRALMNRARMFPGEEQKVFDLFRSNPEMMNELHAPLFEGQGDRLHHRNGGRNGPGGQRRGSCSQIRSRRPEGTMRDPIDTCMNTLVPMGRGTKQPRRARLRHLFADAEGTHRIPYRSGGRSLSLRW